MSSPDPLITHSPPPLALRSRLDLLEQRCAELWAEEPVTNDDRERAFAKLSEIEHRVLGLGLKSLAEPDDPALLVDAEGCEHDLRRLGALWTTDRAA